MRLATNHAQMFHTLWKKQVNKYSTGILERNSQYCWLNCSINLVNLCLFGHDRVHVVPQGNSKLIRQDLFRRRGRTNVVVKTIGKARNPRILSPCPRERDLVELQLLYIFHCCLASSQLYPDYMWSTHLRIHPSTNMYTSVSKSLMQQRR
ncbi:hypothetical protein ABZP36_018639 [Zizania latifolia]